MALLLLALNGCDLLTAPGTTAVFPPTPTPPFFAFAPLVMEGEERLASPRPSASRTPRSAAHPLPAPSTTVQAAALVPTATNTPVPCTSAGRIEQGFYESPLAGRMPYRIYLPPCYGEEERTYPVLYMLPGNTHTDSIWDDLGLDEAADEAIRKGEMAPLLIVMTAGGTLADYTSGGLGSYEMVVWQDLVPFIESHYCAWSNGAGRAIGGMSRGGYWALEIAFQHPEEFTSVGGHSAALYDFYAGPDINPQYAALNRELGDLRLYLDVGQDDWVGANLRQLHEDLSAQGIAHEWTLNEGVHEDAYWRTHVREYLEWYAAGWTKDPGAYPPCVEQDSESTSP